MDLNHSFTVPASVAETWSTFEDIESVAGCFPGATVTEVAGNDFKGTCKVKLGPIALVYSGAGTFLEKDESSRRFVIEAKGKDKRGNGTAGATVTATFAEEGAEATRVDVQTDLAITGKPAQFGRGVIEDISNKLLQQFVTCLQDKVGAPEAPAEEAASEASLASGGDEAAAATATTGSAPQAGVTEAATPPRTAPPPPLAAPRATSGPSGGEEGNALDLGAMVLPILARTYGPPAAIALVALLIGYLLGRRSR
jgi:carbon monoxide dehydrogenase subunit G